MSGGAPPNNLPPMGLRGDGWRDGYASESLILQREAAAARIAANNAAEARRAMGVIGMATPSKDRLKRYPCSYESTCKLGILCDFLHGDGKEQREYRAEYAQKYATKLADIEEANRKNRERKYRIPDSDEASRNNHFPDSHKITEVGRQFEGLGPRWAHMALCRGFGDGGGMMIRTGTTGFLRRGGA